MTASQESDRPHTPVSAQVEGPSSGAVGLTVRDVVPAHLLDGGEVVHFAIKPSPWFVLGVSARWVAFGVLLALIACTEVVPASYRRFVFQIAFWVTVARMGWGTLEWVSRLYVLTNRRVMRIRGVFNVDLFECALDRIQNTTVRLGVPSRIVRVGTITFQTAADGSGDGAGMASWRTVSRPLEIHQALREAIHRAQNRGNHGC